MQLESDKMLKTDRILVLEPIDETKVKGTTGLVDNRLFKGGNKLHAVMEGPTAFWYFKYEAGGLPEPLKQKFTTFNTLLRFAENYFAKRGLKVVRVEA